jgi:hypothetical protein
LPDGTDAFGKLVDEVNFPAFVGDLLKGVFEAIVTTSIDQMKAYAELVAEVTKSLGKFSDENITDQHARDFLVDQLPNLFEVAARGPRPVLPAKRRPATGRQQLLATMVLMGINRIVVTDSKKKTAPKSNLVRHPGARK